MKYSTEMGNDRKKKKDELESIRKLSKYHEIINCNVRNRVLHRGVGTLPNQSSIERVSECQETLILIFSTSTFERNFVRAEGEE